MYDLLIKNACVIDGTGAPACAATVACKDGKLKVLPAECDAEAAKVIDAKGLTLTPGLIDPHSHGDVPLGKEFNSLAKLSQGITTHVAGQCGFSMFPVDPKTLSLIAGGYGHIHRQLPQGDGDLHLHGELPQVRQHP